MKKALKTTVAVLCVFTLLFPAGIVMVAATGTDTVPEGYTPIYTAQEFNNIRNNLSGKYILMNDIDLSSSWKPIGSTDEPFTGELDGNGHSVSDLKISGSYNYVGDLNFGLFTSMEGGSVRNLSLSVDIDVTFTGSAAVRFKAGAIAASADGVTVENCFVSGSINLDSFRKGSAGGLFGYVNMCSPKNCVNYASISLTTNYQMTDISVGGISGKSTVDTFVQCCNYGNITVTGYDITNAARKLNLGGIVGGASNVGGCIIKNCYNKGTIGLDLSTPSTYVGGITAVSYQTENCYNAGQIIIPENYMGLAGEISGDLSTGVSTGTGSYIKNVYYIDNGLYPSYIGGTAPDDSDFENAKLLTEDEFKKQESFVGFDFDDVWVMEEDGYPILKDQTTFPENKPEIPQGAILSGKCGENVYYEFNKITGYLHIYGSGDMDNYDTLSMIGGFDRSPWFLNREHIKTVVIEDGVTSIGDCAFDDCENVISIDMPKTIKSIGWGAFAYCQSLEALLIPDGVEVLGNSVFEACSSLKSISIPKTVTEIGEYVFEYCIALASITVDEENEYFSSDEYGVLFSKSKDTLIRYPAGNERISYNIPDGVERINSFSFKGSDNLINVTIPGSVRIIGSEAFSMCDRIENIDISYGVEKIWNFAFAWCSSLKSITIPESVTEIQYYAFAYCELLENIELPDSLKKIGWNVFQNTAFINNEENWHNGTALYSGKHLISVNGNVEGIFEIKKGTILIAEQALCNASKITEMIIPDSLKYIGSSSFSGCNGLTSVTVPETVISLGRAAFNNCDNLESVEINANITTIEPSMFSGCPKLKNVSFSDTITSIGEYAFSSCDSLETIVLPDNLETLGKNAFESSGNLTNVILPESLVTIGERAFYGTNINSIVIPKNVTSIGECAFAYTSNSKNFEVDAENTAFMTDGRALYSKNGTRLLYYFADDERANYIIPDGVTTIDDYVFAGKENIERVTIPASVTEASGALFRGCDNLKSVAIDGQIKTIGSYSFGECTSLEKVYFSSSVKEIVFRAFYGCTNLRDIYFGGTEEDWNKIKDVKNDSVLNNATIHYNHTHSHSLDAESEQTYEKYGYRLYSCECGHYYAEYDLVSKSDKYDVSATYHPDCFNEEVTLDVDFVTGDREPGGIYMVDGKTYIQVGVYNLKAVNENGEVVQPNEGQKVKIKMAIPDEYKDKTDMVIYHRFVDGGREKLSTSDGTLVVQNGYMIFEITKFSEFEVLAGKAELSISRLPDTLKYRYRSNGLDLSGIQLKLTDIDGSVEYVDDTSKMTVEGFDSTKTGVQTVTVRYEEYTCTFEVEVSYAWWQWIIRILLLGFLWY